MLELFLLIIILVDDRDSDCFSADDECSRDMMARKFALIEDWFWSKVVYLSVRIIKVVTIFEVQDDSDFF